MKASKTEGVSNAATVIIIPAVVISGLLAAVVLAFLIWFCYRKCWRKSKYARLGPRNLMNISSFSDVESLTGRNDHEENIYCVDNNYATITGLSIQSERSSSSSIHTLNSRSSEFFSIYDENAATFTSTPEVGHCSAFVSRSVQTDPQDLAETIEPEQIKKNIPLHADVFNDDVYTITLRDENLQTRERKSRSPAMDANECFNYHCISGNEDLLGTGSSRSSTFQPSYQSLSVLDEDPQPQESTFPNSLTHFQNFDEFVEYYVKKPPEKPNLPILKPILENLPSNFPQSITDQTHSQGGNSDESNGNIVYEGQSSETGTSSSASRASSESSETGNSSWKRKRDEEIEDFQKIRPQKSSLKLTPKSEELINCLRTFLNSNRKTLPKDLGTLTTAEINHGLEFLQEFQKSPEKRTSIQLAQELILLHRPTDNQGRTGLIIGVDATPSFYGGYCVNLMEKKMEYYIIASNDLPWKISQHDYADEFEMKNFLFALSLWNEEISRVKLFAVYTDNNSILRSNHNKYGFGYGKQVSQLVKHFEKCENASLLNPKMHVNRVNQLKSFAKHIQPADDLSRLHIQSSVKFLCEYYVIDKENVKGTHILTQGLYTKEIVTTSFYDEAVDKVKQFVKGMKCEHAMEVNNGLKITDVKSFHACVSRIHSSLSDLSSTGPSLPVCGNSKSAKRRRRNKSRSKFTQAVTAVSHENVLQKE